VDTPVAASTRVIETLIVASLTAGGTWLVTWGATRQRLVNLEERVKSMEAAAAHAATSIADLREGKADRTEVARELAETRTELARGFERLTHRMDQLLTIISARPT